LFSLQEGARLLVSVSAHAHEIASVSENENAGAGAYALSAHFGGHDLEPGVYTLSATAFGDEPSSSGESSTVFHATLRIR
jgi:hypothetical protein